MAIVLDGTANTVTPLNGALGGTTPSTVVATTVVASSTIKGATTIAVGNATPSASGAGITFPATASLSTDVNTLDDYEEGTWTPRLDGSTSGTVATYSSRSGTYVKVGKLVTVTIGIDVSSSTGPTGTYLLLKGLPFTVSNTASTSSIGYWNTFGISAASVGLVCNDSTSFLISYVTAGNANVSFFAPASMPAAGPDFQTTFSYETSI